MQKKIIDLLNALSFICLTFLSILNPLDATTLATQNNDATQTQPKLISANLIWNAAPYCAFTDLLYYKNQFLCCFRESNSHQDGENGTIRILSSPDAKKWQSVASLALEGYDLRDPKLSIMPTGVLLNMGATIWSYGGAEAINSAVAYSADGIHWNGVQVLNYPGEWIWHVAWNNGTAYGCAYSSNGTETQLKLLSSPEGINYTELKTFKMKLSPTEATLRFLPDQTMVALIRRNGGPGVIGYSPPPYTSWKWHKTKSVLGGPDFLILPDGKMWASSRATNGSDTTCVLAKMSLKKYSPVLTFPSAGDCGYPGMVMKDGKLYISYYSSQTGTACIYMAIVQL